MSHRYKNIHQFKSLVSCWWREVSRIRGMGGDGGSNWFDGFVLRRVGDGT